MDQKNTIRNIYISFRSLLSTKERRRADQIICEKIFARTEWHKAETVCLSMSTPDEVDTKPLLAAALNQEKQVLFPKVEGDRLVLHRVTSVKDFLEGKYRILEPKKTTPVIDPQSVDLFIVPGVAFDMNGFRLGHGKGYYDRLLKNSIVPKIGLAYALQVVAELPRSSYDVPMTMVITEEETICQP